MDAAGDDYVIATYFGENRMRVYDRHRVTLDQLARDVGEMFEIDSLRGWWHMSAALGERRVRLESTPQLRELMSAPPAPREDFVVHAEIHDLIRPFMATEY